MNFKENHILLQYWKSVNFKCQSEGLVHVIMYRFSKGESPGTTNAFIALLCFCLPLPALPPALPPSGNITLPSKSQILSLYNKMQARSVFDVLK